MSTIFTRANIGIEASLVTVEVHLGRGLPGFHLVGLPETSVRESKDRVRSAIINSGFEFPSQRITVNLAPAGIPKGGASFDLAIAIGILVASEQIAVKSLDEFEFIGELALSGFLRPVSGTFPIALAAKNCQRSLIIPKENCKEVTLIKDASIYSANNLWEVYLHLIAQQSLERVDFKPVKPTRSPQFDLADIHEQEAAKRALVIAAAGGHNMLMYGPPGAGKSMLASRLSDILPPLNEQQALTVASIRSVTGKPINPDTWHCRPFRQPHHSTTATAMVGGGTTPSPGEISLAHNGVLFLDELPEFERRVLEVFREPLETGEIHISRAKYKVCFPANFQLVAALNPSPTGDINDGRANSDQILRYLSKVSGPLLDRIDIQIHVPKVDISHMLATKRFEGMNTETAIKLVTRSTSIQYQRQGKANAQLSLKEMKNVCQLNDECESFIKLALQKLSMTGRGYHRLLKVARTIADISNTKQIERIHLAEAIQYRGFDKLLSQLANR